MSPFQGWDYAGDTTQGLQPDGRYTLGYSVSPSGLGAGNLFRPSIGQSAPLANPPPDGAGHFKLLIQFSRPAKRAKPQCRGHATAFITFDSRKGLATRLFGEKAAAWPQHSEGLGRDLPGVVNCAKGLLRQPVNDCRM